MFFYRRGRGGCRVFLFFSALSAFSAVNIFKNNQITIRKNKSYIFDRFFWWWHAVMLPSPFGDVNTRAGNVVLVAHLEQILKTADLKWRLIKDVVIVKTVFMEGNGRFTSAPLKKESIDLKNARIIEIIGRQRIYNS
ncbi:hypothetical protein MNBD_CHLOROFLEXI01-992 [hydrothermal vent metagenome]|uniref:Uncharacterized protein n=1 Tax=hydrothermal vent metagenome TaxID=652676 RepID=A0A3B0VPW9_9ZZZZ